MRMKKRRPEKMKWLDLNSLEKKKVTLIFSRVIEKNKPGWTADREGIAEILHEVNLEVLYDLDQKFFSVAEEELAQVRKALESRPHKFISEIVVVFVSESKYAKSWGEHSLEVRHEFIRALSLYLEYISNYRPGAADRFFLSLLIQVMNPRFHKSYTAWFVERGNWDKDLIEMYNAEIFNHG